MRSLVGQLVRSIRSCLGHCLMNQDNCQEVDYPRASVTKWFAPSAYRNGLCTLDTAEAGDGKQGRLTAIGRGS